MSRTEADVLHTFNTAPAFPSLLPDVCVINHLYRPVCVCVRVISYAMAAARRREEQQQSSDRSVTASDADVGIASQSMKIPEDVLTRASKLVAELVVPDAPLSTRLRSVHALNGCFVETELRMHHATEHATMRALARCCARRDVVAAVCRTIATGEAYALIAVSLLACMTAAESAADIIATTQGTVSTLASLLCSPVEQECRLRLLFLLRQLCMSPPEVSPYSMASASSSSGGDSLHRAKTSRALDEVSRMSGVARGCVKSMKEVLAGGGGGTEAISFCFEILTRLTYTAAGIERIRREIDKDVDVLEKAVRACVESYSLRH